MTAKSRSVAYRVLFDIYSNGKYANLALQHGLKNARLEPRDKSLCTEIVYGTVQRQRSLDALLQPLLKRSLSDLDNRVLTILRMTAYQLLFLDRIPSYAAINDAVEITKGTARKAAGFVNGVLRSLMRDGRPVSQRLQALVDECESWADGVGLLYSYPTWIISAWENTYGRPRAERMAELCNRPARLSVRVNPRRTTRSDVLAQVEALDGTGALGVQSGSQDIASPSELSEFGIRFHRGIEVGNWPSYERGEVSVQDEGAMLIAPLLRPNEHRIILDMCAGLGTKTTQIAELQDDAGVVDACDIHQHKLKHLQAAAERLGLQSIRLVLSDARALPKRLGKEASYDAVLIDAPCSGLGVLRHRPDIRWRRSEEDVASLITLQRELLLAAARLVRVGGIIVYATCTILPQENELLVSSVVDDGVVGLAWDDLRDDLPRALHPYAQERRGVTLTPELFGTDGFYMARLRKTEGTLTV